MSEPELKAVDADTIENDMKSRTILPVMWSFPAAVILTAVFDYFFYDRIPGWPTALFLLVLLGCSIPCDMMRLKNRGIYSGAAVALLGIAGTFADPDFLSVFIAVTALLIFRMAVESEPADDLLTLVFRFPIYLFTAPFRIALFSAHFKQLSKFIDKGLGKLILLWIVPIAASLVFIGFFGAANPVIEGWIDKTVKFIGDIINSIAFPSAGRIALWAVVFSFVFAFLWMIKMSRHIPVIETFRQQFVIPSSNLKNTPEKPLLPTEFMNETFPKVVFRSMILFNIVFAVQNLLDVEYLWAGASLPQGMTYAQYAHRGAYPLIFTALLAGLIVLIVFSVKKREGRIWTGVRLMVYLWMLQNVFLVLSSVLRLEKYVSIYSLSRLRVAAFIWMLLVAAGLVLLIYKVWKDKNAVWLLKANALVLGAVLIACCFMDIRGSIASYNVRHCREYSVPDKDGTVPAALDIVYLETLGYPALPAYRFLREKEYKGLSTDTVSKLKWNEKVLTNKFDETLKDWRSWTVRLQLIKNSISTESGK